MTRRSISSAIVRDGHAMCICFGHFYFHRSLLSGTLTFHYPAQDGRNLSHLQSMVLTMERTTHHTRRMHGSQLSSFVKHRTRITVNHYLASYFAKQSHHCQSTFHIMANVFIASLQTTHPHRREHRTHMTLTIVNAIFTFAIPRAGWGNPARIFSWRHQMFGWTLPVRSLHKKQKSFSSANYANQR